jgi:hypothetical protein
VEEHTDNRRDVDSEDRAQEGEVVDPGMLGPNADANVKQTIGRAASR